MKIIYIFVFSFSLLIGSQLSKDEQIKQELNKLKSETIWCSPEDKLQECFDKGAGKTVYLLPGLHLSYVANIHSDTTVYIPKDVTVKLADDAPLNEKGGTVVGIKGTPSERIKNVKVFLDGIIDGNKEVHIKKNHGYEGLNLAYAENCEIVGRGTIQNVNGDGIDIDDSRYCLIKGLKFINNSGNGLHFGSPRPITGSKFNVAMNLYAEGNGYLHNRNGFDLSWPNKDGAFYINSTAKDNRKNWEIDAVGGIVVDSYSQDTGKVKVDDTFGGAEKFIVNNKDITSKKWISKKTKVIFKNDIKKLIGKDNPMFDGVSYGD